MASDYEQKRYKYIIDYINQLKEMYGDKVFPFEMMQNTINLEELIKKVKNDLKINNLRVVKGNDSVSKIAIINGSGQDFIGKAVRLGVDTVITGDTTYHFASDYKEMGINILDVGHFGSEQLIFFNVMKKLKEKFIDIEFITSNVEEDPFIFYGLPIIRQVRQIPYFVHIHGSYLKFRGLKPFIGIWAHHSFFIVRRL